MIVTMEDAGVHFKYFVFNMFIYKCICKNVHSYNCVFILSLLCLFYANKQDLEKNYKQHNQKCITNKINLWLNQIHWLDPEYEHMQTFAQWWFCCNRNLSADVSQFSQQHLWFGGKMKAGICSRPPLNPCLFCNTVIVCTQLQTLMLFVCTIRTQNNFIFSLKMSFYYKYKHHF